MRCGVSITINHIKFGYGGQLTIAQIPYSHTHSELVNNKYINELLTLLKPFNIGTVYAGDNYAYRDKIPADVLVTGKRNAQQIERNHLTLRTRVKRLCRKSICFSKSDKLHKSVVGLFINTFFFYRKSIPSTAL
jgi:hypothetical protein